MNKITSLNNSKFNTFVTFDSGLKLRLPLKAEKMLQKDMIVDIDELVEEFREELLSQALDMSYRYLSYKMRLESEIRSYLSGKFYPTVTVEECLKKLEEYNYLDDEAYVRSYIRSKLPSYYGRKKIVYELGRKGLDEEWVEEVVSGYLTDEMEGEYLERFIERQNRKYRNLFLREKKDRIITSCLRKGYSYDLVGSLCEALVTEDEDLVNNSALRQKIRKRFDRELKKDMPPEQARYRVFSFFYPKGYSEEILNSVYEEILEEYYEED